MAVKIIINGEDYVWNESHRPMSEALALEEATGQRYADLEADLQAGSAKALAAFVWLVWRRNGREVALGDILDGTVEVDLGGLMESLAEIAKAAQEEEPDPTVPSGDAPARTPTTPRSTSRSSRRSTTSAPGR